MIDAINQFTDAIRNSGLIFPGNIIADGRIHRCKANGDRGGKKAGWYLLHLDQIPTGAFGDWRTGITHKWCARKQNELTLEEKDTYRQQLTRIKEKHQIEEHKLREDAQKKAIKLWDRAGIIDNKHPYLVHKGIKPVSAKQIKNMVVLPLRDVDNTLYSLQFIMSNGSKRFLSGGRKHGCFATLGQEFDTVCICEGWATGLSIYQATEITVAVSFDAVNLQPVAKALRKIYPQATIVICADDDYQTANNPGLISARNAAKAVKGLLAIPAFGKDRPEGATDFNDLHQHCGLDAVKQIIDDSLKHTKPEHKQDQKIATTANPETHSDQGDQWPPLILPGSIKLPGIDASILPSWAGNMARALADDLQVDEGAVVLPALSMIAAAIQRRFEVAPLGGNSYYEPLALWTITVLPSGSRKTPILNALTDPLKRWEKLIGDRMKREIAANEAARRVAKKRIEKLETLAGSTDDQDKREELQLLICNEIEATPREIKPPRLMTGDITPEQLQTMLVEQHERMALISDEGGIFQVLSGQYSSGMAIMDVFLQSYSGSAARIDRRSRQAFLEKPALTFCLMLQPGILQNAANDHRFHDSGLLARFLYSIPESRIGHRNVRQHKPIPETIRQPWRDELLNLLFGAERPTPEPKILPFTPEARELWLDFSQEVEDELGDNGKLCDLLEWGSKLPGSCARIAGLMQFIVAGQHAECVEVDAVKRAIALCEKLIVHAKAAHRIFGADGVENDALHLMRWIQANKLLEFDRSHAQKSLEGRFRTVDRLKAAAQRMNEWNVLSVELQRPNKGARPTPYYRVNPKLFDNSINSP